MRLMQNVVKYIYSFKFIMIKSHTELSRYPAGTVVSIDCGFYRHVGMLAQCGPFGERLVVAFSATANGLIEHSLGEFSGGRPVQVDGYLGKLIPDEVMLRARQWQGQSYDLFSRNCEHFVRFAHGLPPTSPQIMRAGVALLTWFVMRPACIA